MLAPTRQQVRKLSKKLKKIRDLEERVAQSTESSDSPLQLNAEQRELVAGKSALLEKFTYGSMLLARELGLGHLVLMRLLPAESCESESDAIHTCEGMGTCERAGVCVCSA